MDFTFPPWRQGHPDTFLGRFVLGVFLSARQVGAALEALRDAGFTDDQFGVLARADVNESSPGAPGEERAVSEGAAADVGPETLWGLNLAAGLLPAIGPVIAGGILGSVLASAVAGTASSTGRLASAFASLGLTDEKASYFEREVTLGHILVNILAGQRAEIAAAILRNNGARNVQDSSDS